MKETNSFDLTEEWNMGRLTFEQVEAWLKDQVESEVLSNPEKKHVAMCMFHIYEWHMKNRPLGGFLTAVVSNDFMKACGKADGINRKALWLYARFMYNVAPMNYRKKAEAFKGQF